MKATIAICTRNRAELLSQTLATLAKHCAESLDQLELLVIDNGSTDRTQAIARSFSDHLPVRVVVEHNAGLSNARNRAIHEAKGEYIVWTDDDVLVEPNWISSYLVAFNSWPEAAFFGGPIRPWFDGTPPDWILGGWPFIEAAFAARDLGTESFAIDTRRLPFGANFVVRTDWQRRFEYNPQLGRRPGFYWIGGEEVDVLQRVMAAGGMGQWVPDAAVRHWIPKERQTYGYVRRYYSGIGRTEHLTEGTTGRLKIAGVPVWLIRMWLSAELRLIAERVFHPADVWSKTLVAASVLAGRVAAALRDREPHTRSAPKNVS